MTDLCKEIEKLGKGIGNVNRYHILESLMKGPKTVSDIVRDVKLSQPAVSQHLKALKSSNLVTDTRKGKEVLYTLDVQYMTKLLHFLAVGLAKKKKA